MPANAFCERRFSNNRAVKAGGVITNAPCTDPRAPAYPFGACDPSVPDQSLINGQPARFVSPGLTPAVKGRSRPGQGTRDVAPALALLSSRGGRLKFANPPRAAHGGRRHWFFRLDCFWGPRFRRRGAPCVAICE